jgi:hypothetical protein
MLHIAKWTHFMIFGILLIILLILITLTILIILTINDFILVFYLSTAILFIYSIR